MFEIEDDGRESAGFGELCVTSLLALRRLLSHEVIAGKTAADAHRGCCYVLRAAAFGWW